MQELYSTAGESAPRAAGIAWAGLIALAVAMGIGRFAFTPIMPMMEADAGLTMVAASWLAAANYLGYLVGALCAARLSLAYAVRGGLLLIAVVTAAMGATHGFVLQLALRFLAGVASAWVMVHVSAWALQRLLQLRRSDANGVVFAGVGAGIAVAGLAVMGAMHARLDSSGTWWLVGVLSLLATLSVWRWFGHPDAREAVAAPAAAPRPRWTRDKLRLMWCYGAMGIGYIIPATYLPDMAHRYVTNPLVFGLAWPVFGAAAALSTWIAARWLGSRIDDRRLWAVCHVLMAIGVGLPALWPTLPAILIAALLVGGTFMVVAMLALREARRVALADATAFIGAMTAAFAVGQIVGPLIVGAVARLPHGFVAALLGAAVLLLLAAASLWRSAARANA